MNIAEASAKHHSDSLCLAAHKMHVNEKRKEKKSWNKNKQTKQYQKPFTLQMNIQRETKGLGILWNC